MIYGLSGSEIVKIAEGMGMKSCNEVFADRTYQDNGELTPRTEANALIGDDDDALKQVLNIIQLVQCRPQAVEQFISKRKRSVFTAMVNMHWRLRVGFMSWWRHRASRYVIQKYFFDNNIFQKISFIRCGFPDGHFCYCSGFITQTTVFTQQLLTSFGFIILCSILLDIAAQLNIWRVIAVSELRAQDLANKLCQALGMCWQFNNLRRSCI